MPEVDPLILQVSADLRQYRAEINSATSLVTNRLGRQEMAVKNLERQMQRSSGAISGSLKGIAVSLAGAFSVQQIGGLIDNFTRLQNALRVAGLEGAGLANVQAKLLDLSGRYGVSINELADLFGKSSQAASELGASEAQLLQITEASAQALKITGTSATQAQGALLGLTQALSSGIVRAEEFNQINEGGLRPLLQAAANAERFGGSVAKLRAAVVDGKFSSQEFYQAILQGSAELDSKASKATLTLAGAFTALASQLTVYVGEASASNGATSALAAGIAALANNLNILIPALAIIATGLGVGLVTNSIAARASLAAVTAQAAGTTGALATMGVAARSAGTALLGAFGGPIGVAVTALALGIGYLVTQTSESAVAAQANARAQELSAQASQSGADAAERLASAHGKARVEALTLARAERENIKQKLASARASLILAQAELGRAKAFGAAQNAASIGASTPGGGLFIQGTGDKRKALARQSVADQEARISGLEKGLGAIDTAIRGGNAPKIAAIGDPQKPKKSKAGSSRASRSKGPDFSELRDRAESQLNQLDQELISAKLQLVEDAKARASLQQDALLLEAEQRNKDLAANKDLSAQERAAQQRIINELFGVAAKVNEQGETVTQALPGLLAQRIQIDELRQLSQDAVDLANIENDIKLDALKEQYALATSNADRLRISLEIVDIETKAALAAVDNQLLDADISKAKREQLEAIRRGIVAEQGRATRNATVENQGALDQYLAEINSINFGDQAEAFGVDALKELNAGLSEAIVNGGNLGDVLEDTGKRFIKQLLDIAFQLLVIKPLLQALGESGGGGGGSGGGGGFKIDPSSLLSLFGAPKASGGPVTAGKLFRVNESQQEFFQPAQNGKIITMGQMQNKLAQSGSNGGGGVSIIRVQLSGDMEAKMVETARGVSVEVTRQFAPSIVNAGAAKALRDSARGRI